jgi:tRNA G26 N,N-dimethylase Trm1
MAIGAKYRCTVGEVEKKYEENVRMLINELARTCTKVSNMSFSLSIHYDNGYFCITSPTYYLLNINLKCYN